MKLLVDADSGKVVGRHVLGADAAEIVQMAAICVAARRHQGGLRRHGGAAPDARRGARYDAREVVPPAMAAE